MSEGIQRHNNVSRDTETTMSAGTKRHNNVSTDTIQCQQDTWTHQSHQVNNARTSQQRQQERYKVRRDTWRRERSFEQPWRISVQIRRQSHGYKCEVPLSSSLLCVHSDFQDSSRGMHVMTVLLFCCCMTMAMIGRKPSVFQKWDSPSIFSFTWSEEWGKKCRKSWPWWYPLNYNTSQSHISLCF